MNKAGLDQYSSSDSSDEELHPCSPQNLSTNERESDELKHVENRKRAAVAPDLPRKRLRTGEEARVAVHSGSAAATTDKPLPASASEGIKANDRPFSRLPPPPISAGKATSEVSPPPPPPFSCRPPPPDFGEGKVSENLSTPPLPFLRPNLKLGTATRSSSQQAVRLAGKGPLGFTNTHFVPPQLQLKRPNVSTEDLTSFGCAQPGRLNKR